MKITLYTLTCDTENGMSTEIFTTEARMLGEMLAIVEARDEAVADALGKLEAGSDEWYDAWSEWREAQSYENNYYSHDEHEVEIELPKP